MQNTSDGTKKTTVANKTEGLLGLVRDTYGATKTGMRNMALTLTGIALLEYVSVREITAFDVNGWFPHNQTYPALQVYDSLVTQQGWTQRMTESLERKPSLSLQEREMYSMLARIYANSKYAIDSLKSTDSAVIRGLHERNMDYATEALNGVLMGLGIFMSIGPCWYSWISGESEKKKMQGPR